jgi:outer membrane protein TolC
LCSIVLTACIFAALSASLRAQESVTTTAARQPSKTLQPSTVEPATRPTPSPSATPFSIPSISTSDALPQTSRPQTSPPQIAPSRVQPSPSPAPALQSAPIQTPASTLPPVQPSQTLTERLTRDEAVRLALGQASTFEQATLNERIAAEEVRQSRRAFLPGISAAPSYIYTSPARGSSSTPDTPRPPSFIANNAISEYSGLVNATGELDISGRLRATLRRNVALLEAARAGTAVARRALIAGIDDAYYGLALATAKLRAAEQNLAAALWINLRARLRLPSREVK